MIAFAALAATPVASAKKKTHTVDATMTLAIIEQPPGINEFAARFTGKPFGTAAAVGEVAVTNTPTGLITEGRPVIYAKKGTVNLETRNVVEIQPDGSITLNGTAKATGGTGKYKGARQQHVQRHASTRARPDRGHRGHLRRGRQGSVLAGAQVWGWCGSPRTAPGQYREAFDQALDWALMGTSGHAEPIAAIEAQRAEVAGPASQS